MSKTKLIVIGGFLGAGKTTTILSLAKKLLNEGKKIGIVTNDQGSNLVDTEYLASQGFPVLEVSGGCFCCNFDEFTQKLNELSKSEYPDYIIAEPVGSCTDLVASICKPIKAGYQGQFSLMPLTIVVDPKRLKRVISEKDSPFPNEINYLFKKQIEEADIIALNKTDELTQSEIDELTSELAKLYRGVTVLPISALKNNGIDLLSTQLVEMTEDIADNMIKEISYDTYGKAEAFLGWLNSSAAINITNNNKIDGNLFVESLANDIKSKLVESNNEIAHLKIYMVSSGDYCKLSLVSIFEDIYFDKKMTNDSKDANIIINIRANIAPDILKSVTEGSLLDQSSKFNVDVVDLYTEAFAPSQPSLPKIRSKDTGDEKCSCKCKCRK